MGLFESRWAYALALLLAIVPVLAHGTPLVYSPEPSATVDVAPSRVVVALSERAEPRASSIDIYSPDGKLVSTGQVEADGRLLARAMENAGPGTYTVVWQAVSADDGHFSKGAYVFTVSDDTTPLTVRGARLEVQHLTSIPETALIWLMIAAQSLLLGLMIARRMWRYLASTRSFPVELERSFNIRSQRFLLIGSLVLLSAATALLVLKTVDLMQLTATSFFSTFIVFAGTSNGILLLGTIALTIPLCFFRRSWPDKGEAFFRVLLLLMAYGRVRVSHAAATDFQPAVSIFVNLFHLIAKEAFVGTLIVAAFLLFPLFVKSKDNASLVRSSILTSVVTSTALGITAATGIYIVWLHLKLWENLATTEWGVRFSVFLLFFAAILFVRMYHILVVDPGGVQYSLRKKGPDRFRHIDLTVPLEMLLGLVMLLVTGLLIITTPPFMAEQYSFERHADSGGVAVDLSVHQHETSMLRLTFTREAQPLEPSSLFVSLSNPSRSIEELRVTPTQRSPHTYVFSQNALSAPGQWQVTVWGRDSSNLPFNVRFEVEQPTDLSPVREVRSFGLFEGLLVLSVALIIFFFSLLVGYSLRLLRQMGGRS